MACNATIGSMPYALTTCPENNVPTMNAADPVPRTQPYSKPRRPLLGGAAADPSAKASDKIVIGAKEAAKKRRRRAKRSNRREQCQHTQERRFEQVLFHHL